MSFSGIASIKRASDPDSYINFLGSIETFSNYLNVVLEKALYTESLSYLLILNEINVFFNNIDLYINNKRITVRL